MIRRPWLSLLGLLISALLCVLLCTLSGYLDGEKARLSDVRNSYDILCVVSDIRGTKTDGLGMSHIYSDFLLDKENGIGAFVRDARLTKVFSYRLDGGAGQMIGVSGETSAEVLDSRLGGEFETDEEGFFLSEEYLCLMPQNLYPQYAGQTVTVEVTDTAGASPLNPNGGTGKVEFRVAGWYRGTGTEIYIPYPASQRLGFLLAGLSTTDSAAFLLADNSRLDELSAAAQPMLMPVNPGEAAPKGLYALTIHDEQYHATLTAMEQNIRRLQYLLPLIALLSLGAGFLVGVLATRGEARTYALMRTVGLTRGKLFCTVLLQQMLLPVLASGAAAVILRQPLPAAGFLLCLAVGCALAIGRSVRIAPSAILRSQE